MNCRVFFLCVLAAGLQAQNLRQCKYRFDTYLNFRGTLDAAVRFENDAFYLTDGGKKEIVVYSSEIPVLSEFCLQSSFKQQEQLFRLKGTRRLTQSQLDSLGALSKKTDRTIAGTKEQPLKGYKIALDPGHFSTNLADAQSEQKYIFFVTDTARNRADTVKIFESLLNFNTAHILKNMLEEKGAEVFLTRQRSDYTSFDCTFQEWIRLHRKRTLDSLKLEGTLSMEKHKKLLTCNQHTLFWEFFRDYDLLNRANKVNAFEPDVTVIIHYNVDEKNSPWKQSTKKNFSMTFIGGGFTADNLKKTDGKINFMRLLITDQLNRSEDLSAKTVSNFNRILEIPIARAPDADYLRDNCMVTASPGVFCRNLALCRKINSVLVYGESLYQDNEKETKLLMRSDLDIYGIKANERLSKVALCYYEALAAYLKQH